MNLKEKLYEDYKEIFANRKRRVSTREGIPIIDIPEKVLSEESKKAMKEALDNMTGRVNFYTGVAIIVMSLASFILDPFIGVTLFGLLTSLFLFNGFGEIKKSPPHKATVAIWGERIKELYLDEGIYFLPFQGLLFDVDPEDVEEKPLKHSVNTRTPDKAPVQIDIGLAIVPIDRFLVNYQNSGGLKGVTAQLFGEISERLREWAEGGEEGPSKWQELYQSKTEAASILIKRIAGTDYLEKHGHGIMPDYSQKVPTPVWMKFFSKERDRRDSWKNEQFFENEKAWAGEDGKWEEVWKVIDEFSNTSYQSIDQIRKDKNSKAEKLMKEVGKRRKLTRDIQSGKGPIIREDLGIRIKRLNVSNVEVKGKPAEAAEEEAKEVAEREAAKEEIENFRDRVKELESDGFSKKEAKEIAQSESSKVPIEIKEHKFSVSDDSASKEVLKHAISKMFGEKDG